MREIDKDWMFGMDNNNILLLVKMFYKGLIIYLGIMYDLFI